MSFLAICLSFFLEVNFYRPQALSGLFFYIDNRDVFAVKVLNFLSIFLGKNSAYVDSKYKLTRESERFY